MRRAGTVGNDFAQYRQCYFPILYSGTKKTRAMWWWAGFGFHCWFISCSSRARCLSNAAVLQFGARCLACCEVIIVSFHLILYFTSPQYANVRNVSGATTVVTQLIVKIADIHIQPFLSVGKSPFLLSRSLPQCQILRTIHLLLSVPPNGTETRLTFLMCCPQTPRRGGNPAAKSKLTVCFILFILSLI